MPLATETDAEELPLFSRLDFKLKYREFTYDYPSYSSTSALRRGFLRRLAKMTSEPHRVMNNIGWCVRCTYPEDVAYLRLVRPGRYVCRDCVQHYSECGNCGYMERSTRMFSVMNVHYLICTSCHNSRTSFCDTCDGSYMREHRAQHRHDVEGDSCCSSPAEKFKIPNNNGRPLANDRRISVELPAGEISEEGLKEIRAKVRAQMLETTDHVERQKWVDLAHSLDALGAQWQTRQGNYTRRLSRHAYKTQGLKVPAELMTAVGNIARDHSKADKYLIAVTRKLNQSARKFGHAESCWWQSYYNSRCAFKTNGGFGIRSFNKSQVTGRAWVMPLKKEKNRFTPTFETMTPDAYIVFNGYGQLGGYVPARILAQMMGKTYRKVEFTGEPMYVNSSSGYLIGTEEMIDSYTDGSIRLPRLEQHSRLFQNEVNMKELVNA